MAPSRNKSDAFDLSMCHRSSPAKPRSSPWPFASSTSSNFSRAPAFFARSTSPTLRHNRSSASVWFSTDHRPISPTRSISVRRQSNGNNAAMSTGGQRRTCMCSPTTHPGSFRCSLHRGVRGNGQSTAASCHSSSRLNCRRSAMANSLVRIGVEGDLVKRALTALIRPCSQHLQRRAPSEPRPSRLSRMSKADDF